MNDIWNTILGLAIPFAGTTFGASLVYLLKNEIKSHINKLLLGLASGLMIAASIWSLIMPSISSGGIISASLGFVAGILLMIGIDYVISLNHLEDDKRNSSMLMLAVTIHNVPEGMAVGVAFASLFTGNDIITLAGAFSLAIGIGIQNIPEGTIISMPLKGLGYTKTKAFYFGFLTGAVEPVAAIITILLINLLGPILPFLLALAAGCMIYVVINELIPTSQVGSEKNYGTIGVMIGFTIMMILDVVLG
jgi:ZIP family zinc transporter